MSPNPGSNGWALEVVRGREVGRSYPLPGGEVVLGNAVGAGGGIDLAGQEGDSPRRMAGRQAAIDCRGGAVVLRDLDSPGGTFVNRRRILQGQGQPLRPGDLIQLGGVQLKLVARGSGSTADPAAPAPRPKPTPPAPSPTPPAGPAAPLAFAMEGGPTCRTWDDFLAVSAQRWAQLRDELTSGRLAGHLAAIGRSDLAPRPDTPGSPDDRLDAWLASLPTTRAARPEVDVHPRSIVVKAAPGGGRTRRSFRVANVGYRLLKSRVRVEPPDASWLVVPAAFAREFATVEEAEVPFEVVVPESFAGRLSASLVVEGNGGSTRVSVAIEAPDARVAEPLAGAVEGPDPVGLGSIREAVAAWLARRSAAQRVIGGAVVGLAGRLAIGAACGFSGVATLPGPAAVLAAIGAAAGMAWIGRRGGPRDAPAGAFAGAFAGLVLAAAVVAACEAIEPILGASLSADLAAVSALWAAIGAAVGGASLAVVPMAGATKGGGS